MKPHLIPNIQYMLLKLGGFSFATSLDPKMGYYDVQLTLNASWIFTIALPWVKYKYFLLPIIVSVAPKILQEKNKRYIPKF